MHPQRKKRLKLILFLVIGFGVAVGLLMYSLSQNINLFQTPTQIANGEVPVGRTIRAGGLVVDGSVQRDEEGLAVTFQVTDGAATVPIHYEGILPDLFREGQGIVALGKLDEHGVIQASEVLAKHDENYMPPEVQDALEQAHEDGKQAMQGASATSSSYSISESIKNDGAY
ncbi:MULTISPECIES: cytochrome c maturation protein CcmE [unclassified Oceanobacter]|jgi:cytochrome c-type biogenesis protein CcmE|uniref:cytochrome c maturation protein CcmE n=1 Tax=unclassified Oceanobacter TaxID=2620260 RepID=UPI0026E3F591|nr:MULTISPECIES: cytochrome c maturation protein CcmE [unclassified Oceanobacter]MDO6682513.1 cytochrome c maturation protein CcmE [Oceanobacter sp. 5_MG-2023]MDP2506468.1 cytochrome c maturation protein CcmE [Oceanobacter sp. 3_MG-2023]MDP2549019.1 cytochrome c maturation protein CcmE [Oceanobacter sp. 4_MG-2023]MDP2609157.1 cytochrome c maturation protein CcmE [Oceanobacter sp. 1_MG-2023]MDP2612551.1 cytochrome c maturation protein CcmE [Oceanobacter sp. 2_MG-2023]